MHQHSKGFKRSGLLFSRHKFTKADRLLKRSEFIHLAKNGKRLQNQNFIAYVQKNKLCRCRLGITVTRKVGNAATRNRIKRVAREFFRQHRHLLQEHWDISLIAKREVAHISNKSIVISLEKLFARIETYHHP